MLNGIFHVRFSSSLGDSGEGLVVMRDGSVNGGDYGYLYQGRIASEGGRISGDLRIKRWNPAATSVFGALQEFVLQLAGSESPDNSFQVSGDLEGHSNLRITIAGRRLSALV